MSWCPSFNCFKSQPETKYQSESPSTTTQVSSDVKTEDELAKHRKGPTVVSYDFENVQEMRRCLTDLDSKKEENKNNKVASSPKK